MRIQLFGTHGAGHRSRTVAVLVGLSSLVFFAGCGDDQTPACGDGVLEGAERCDRFEGASGSKLSAGLIRLDQETGSPDSEVELDEEGAAVLRTRLEIEFADSATIADGNRILDAISGRITMMLPHVPIVLVQIPDPGSRQALEALSATIAADPAVLSVSQTGPAATDVLPDNFVGVMRQSPEDAALDLETIDHLLSIRSAAAWNARAANRSRRKPTVVIVDKFGDGVPNADFSTIGVQATDFASGNNSRHGYTVAGILLGSFGGSLACHSRGAGP